MINLNIWFYITLQHSIRNMDNTLNLSIEDSSSSSSENVSEGNIDCNLQ